MQAKLDQGFWRATSRGFTLCAMSMLFRSGGVRASCGRALQIFPEAMTDNILVIDVREPRVRYRLARLSARSIVVT
ncbi:hypothetical protein QA649_08810 [Bradyrhizobium sp. CB1717]|uniref:hypothetical protein n=1 Tax=Bradyrhizobium sp. CB1717 TaxID=3039154 RepID=UPI0024B1BF7D|nr:hypothetical protein [Bradyrhizobium sp. CB1717]WFU26291.1 hypothetical protein QA649_08810 [Bradyrhizobium sp. CB1717]